MIFGPVANAQSNVQNSDSTITNFVIPTNIKEAHLQLDSLLSDEDIVKIKNLPDANSTIKYHMGLGIWLRNNWGLWAGSDLYIWFYERGYNHPDNVSGIILQTYWNYLNDKPYLINDRFGSEWEENQREGSTLEAEEFLALIPIDYMQSLISEDSLNVDDFQKLVSLHGVMLERDYEYYYPFEDNELKNFISKVLSYSFENIKVMRSMLKLASQEESEVVNLIGWHWEDELLKALTTSPILFAKAYVVLTDSERDSISYNLEWHYEEHHSSILDALEIIKNSGLGRIADDIKLRIQKAKDSYDN